MFRTHRATICWTLIAVMAISPSMVYAQAAATPKAEAAKPGEKLDVSYVVPDAVFGAVAFPRRVLTAPEMAMMPIEVLSAAGMKEAGIDPVDIEEIILVAEAPQQSAPPSVGVVARLAKPYALESILPKLQRMTEEAQIEGKTYRRAAMPFGPSMYMPDDRTLILATEPMLQKMVANHAKPVEGRVSRLFERVGKSSDFLAALMVEPLRPLVNAQLAQAPVPPPFADVKKVPDMVDMVGVKANLVGQTGGLLSITAKDEATAIELEKMIGQWLDMGRQMMHSQMAQEMARQSASGDPVEQAGAKYAQRISGHMLDMLRPKRQGNRLILGSEKSTNSPQAQVATVGILIALLLPAVQAAREAARRAQSISNMKQLGLCMFNYQDAHKTFPARAILDKDGKPLLSWRVAILPYLDQGDLYGQFKLDEPWDSPNNKKLIERMPPYFRNPSSGAPPNTTTYLAPVGPGTVFEGDKGRTFRDIRDGTSNTVMLVEANDDQAVIWTRPDDWQYDPEKPLAGLGSAHPRLFSALFCDGSVRGIAADIQPVVWKALLTIAGGEVVPPGSRP
jgi:hypothetical protein